MKYSFKNSHKKKFFQKLNKKIKFPLVIKPINEGSSVNVFISHKKNYLKNLSKLKEYGEVLFEKYVSEFMLET